jgi:hypothetical protein
MFTRQHYKAIAEIIAKNTESFPYFERKAIPLDRLVNELARFFARDNPRFSRERFETACKGGKA